MAEKENPPKVSVPADFCPHYQAMRVNTGYEIVCGQCGLIIDDADSSGHYVGPMPPYFKSQGVDPFLPAFLFPAEGVGSFIDNYTFPPKYDYRGRTLSARKKTLFRKLWNYERTHDRRNRTGEGIILAVLTDVAPAFNERRLLWEWAIKLYRKIFASARIVNQVSCLAYCVVMASREIPYFGPISVEEICNIFTGYGYRVTPTHIMRDGGRYWRSFPQKACPPGCKEYLFKLKNIVEDSSLIHLTLGKKGCKWAPADYAQRLFQMSHQILKWLPPRIRQGHSPLTLAAAIIYGADQALAYKNNTKFILTCALWGRAIQINGTRIQDQYAKHIKPILSQHDFYKGGCQWISFNE